MLDPIGILYRQALRPLLFHLDAETAHTVAASALGLTHRSSLAQTIARTAVTPCDDPVLSIELWGKTFRSPLGIAGGLDKTASFFNALGALGFAHVEVGTVTPQAQPGNPRPRLFRLPADRAIVNRMGFNNPGAEAIARALSTPRAQDLRLGINLGKSRSTTLSNAPADYASCAALLAPMADWMVINVSSPNTPGLRSLQSVASLSAVLDAVRTRLADGPGANTPLLVKLAPDLHDDDLDRVIDLACEHGLGGVIACNTTVRRDGLRSPEALVRSLGDGGLSGRPLRERTLEVVQKISLRSHGALTIIGVGGVSSADDVWNLLSAGASLVQIYTSFIYEGPTLAASITRALAERAHRAGLSSIASLRPKHYNRP